MDLKELGIDEDTIKDEIKAMVANQIMGMMRDQIIAEIKEIMTNLIRRRFMPEVEQNLAKLRNDINEILDESKKEIRESLKKVINDKISKL